MPSRKEEHLTLQPFQIGALYSRPDIASLGQVAPLVTRREWTGIVEFMNCVVLFVTLDKSGRDAQYAYTDFFQEELFYWDSQAKQTQNSPVISKILDGAIEVVLFCRISEKQRSKTQPFVYCGSLLAEDYQDEQPVRIRFRSLNFARAVTSELDDIYDWETGSAPPLLAIVQHEVGEGIPDGITRQDLLEACQTFDEGVEHAFGPSTHYDVISAGKRYPPKAIVGIAARHLSGGILKPSDFSGGIGSKCFRVLSANGFEIISKGPSYPDDVEAGTGKSEGGKKQVYVNRYERDPAARKKCLEHHSFACKVCVFDFAKTFGVIGHDFIHVHHLKQLSELDEAYVPDPISDLVPVCPNCHAMLHKRRPPYSINELKEILRREEVGENDQPTQL